MTQFEKDFVLRCLDYFKLIMTDQDELQSAIKNFSGTNSDHSRYHSNGIISDSEYWIETDKLNFSAAVFESTARASYDFLTQPDFAEPVSTATTKWRSDIVPLLIVNTNPNERISSILSNCSLMEERINNEIPTMTLASSSEEEAQINHPPSASPASFISDNPYAFFATVVGVAVVAALGTTLTLK